MSSTSNAQDLLVNVFRPTYKWDSNTGFVPSLVVSNVTEVIAGKIKANALVVSDNNVNTYIGADAGLRASNTLSNVGIGFSAMAGSLNATSNVAIGTFALEGLSNSDSNVAIGAATDISGVGMRNVLIGTNVTLTGGSNNILIGVDLSRATVSNSLQIGTLLYGNLSNGYIGINTSVPTRPLDVSGEVVFRNKVGIQKDNPVYTLDIAGSVYATEQIIGGKGNVSNPMYTFIDSSGSGMYVPELSEGFGTGAFAISVNRGPAAIFSSNRVNFYQSLDVSGTFTARNIDISAFAVTAGTQSKPAMTFVSDLSSGLYLVSSNRVGVSTGGLRRMEILSNGDVSAGRLVAQDISLSGTITTSTGCNVIGGVTLSNGNVILTGVATNTNLLVPGWIRNTDPATQFDISGGNISNSLTTRSSNFRASSGAVSAPAYSFVSDPSVGLHLVGTSTLGFDTSGVQRMCISGGFVGIGRAAPVVALDVLGDVSATTYNGPGGTQTAPHYTFSDDRTTGVFFPGANMIGMTAGGTERMRISNGNVGIGTTAPTNALDVSGTLRVIGVAGDLTFSNGNINLAGVPLISSTGVLSNASTTSNSIGGVTLSNTNITFAGVINNTVSTTSNQIGGVTLSNSTISNSLTSSNRIGGTVLSNYDVSLTGGGRILGLLASANTIGGVTLCNNQVSNSSFTTSSQFIASADGTAGSPGHTFGTESGLGLYKSAAGTLAVATGGVLRSTFSNGNFSNAGLITTSNVRVSDGAVGTPAYSFTGETNLGLYRPTAGTLALVTSGSNRMTVDSNGVTTINRYTFGGNYFPTLTVVGDVSAETIYVGKTEISNDRIGIGMSPGVALDVSTTLRVGNGRALFDVTPTGASSNYASMTTNGYFTMYKAGTTDKAASNVVASFAPDDKWYILSNNVGIGTSAPASILDISFASTPGVVVRKCGLTLSNTAGYGTLKVRAGPTNDIYVEDGNVNPTSLTASGQYTGWIFGTSSNVFGTNSRFGFYRVVAGGETAGFRPFTIDTTGYIGMGTVAPVGQLSVHNPSTATGAVNVLALSTGSIKNSAYSEIQFRGSDSGTGNVYLAGIAGVDSATGAEAYHGDIAFTTTQAAGQTYERMRLKWDGTVGIGTTTPAYRLDVQTPGQGVAADVRIYAGHGYSSGANKANLRLASRGSGGGYVETGFQHDYNSNYGMSVLVTNSTTPYVRFDSDNSRVGIGKVNPGYALDVVAGSTTTAAISMSTWPRYATSVCHYAKGLQGPTGGGAIATYSCLFNSGSPTLNSELGTIQDSANNGTSFICKKSGIWSITFRTLIGTELGSISIDIVTDPAENSAPNTQTSYNRALVHIYGGYFSGCLSYTGYLPASATNYYKFKVLAQPGVDDRPGAVLSIAFLGEQ